MVTEARIALCLPGGGATGAMFQLGALVALEDSVEGFRAHELDVYVGSNGGASVAAVLAGGRPAQRLYRALLDPADPYFGLERRHLLRVDMGEYRRTVKSAGSALRRGLSSLLSRKELPHPHSWWEELDRLYDALPAGLFTLEAYERFLEDFFVRRSVPNSFLSIPTTLRILAHDLDSGEPVAFGSPSFDHVTVTRACIASMAVPPFFSPVRIGDRHYIDPGAAQLRHLDIAAEQGAEVVLFINPMVPIRATRVPTGHGLSASLRDKGMLWVVNQAIRIGVSAAAHAAERRVRDERAFAVIVIEPEPEDTVMFLNNPSSFAARRTILEQSYKSTRALLSRYFEVGHPGVRRAGWRPAESGPASMRPSAAPKP